MVTRGEVWLVSLDPTVGHEIQKTRPCLVVSPDRLGHLNLHMVAPMTSHGRPAPFRPPITFQGKSGRVLIEQLRTVSRQRMIKRLGVADAEVVRASLAALRQIFEG